MKLFIHFSPGSLQATAVHYTVHVTLQYRYPPAEFSHSNSFAVSGGFMRFVWQDAQKLHVNTAVPWADLGTDASHASHDDREISSLKPTSREKHNNNRTGHSFQFFSQLWMHVYLHPCRFMFEGGAQTQRQQQVHLSEHMQTITSKSTWRRSQRFVAAVSHLNYCLCGATGTTQSALQVKGGTTGPQAHKQI